MNNELRQEEIYESYGGKDSGFCLCGKELNDDKECDWCEEIEEEEPSQAELKDAEPREIGSMAL